MSGLITSGAGWVRGQVAALTAPARDPRSVYSNPLEPHYESLMKLRAAREEVWGAIERLSDMAGRASTSLDRIDEAEIRPSGNYTLELRLELKDELKTLNRKIESLSDEHQSLLRSERRLISSLRRGAVSREMEDATSTSREAKEAAQETLAGLGTELRRLDRALDSANSMGRQLETKTAATTRIAHIDSPDAGTVSATERQAMNILRRYAAAVEEMVVDESTISLEQGLKAVKSLVYEYQQLKSLIEETSWPEEREVARLTIMTELACRRGLGLLEAVYQQTLDPAIEDSPPEVSYPATRSLIDAEACEKALRNAHRTILEADRDEMATVVVEAAEVIRGAMTELEDDPAIRDKRVPDKI